MGISLIIPVNNEESGLDNALTLLNYLKNLSTVKKFEILLCDNGSTDNTYKNAKQLSKKHPQIKALHVKERGLGLGIKKGIENASYDYLFFYAIDLPFGLEIIEQSLKEINNCDVVVGSKGHKDSHVARSFLRNVYSFCYNTLINIFFQLNVKDTQGSLLFKKQHTIKYLKYLDAKDAFLEAQILINSKRLNLKIKEIPITLNETGQRKTRIKIIRDGITIMRNILRERFKKINI